MWGSGNNENMLGMGWVSEIFLSAPLVGLLVAH